MLKVQGYDVTVQTSTKSRSGAMIIKINNPGNGKNISQVQVSPGGGRHGANPYVKISTTDQGIIKIVDGVESTYKTDGKETAKIIFTGGK
jgi:filamentous hemagglutinin